MAVKPPALPIAPKEYDADYINRTLRILTQHLSGQADGTQATAAADINNSAAKTALVSADEIGFWDSVTQRLNKITWANTLTQLNGTYEVLSHKNAASGYAGLSATYQIQFVNNAGTFTSLLTNANTAARTYTFPDKSMTVAAVDSEAFTGTPSLPAGTTAVTQSAGTNTTQLATTAFVLANRGKPIAQFVTTKTGAVATGTTVIPIDDTIPQSTEGDQYMSLSITPTNASSILEIEVVFFGSNSVVNNVVAALFQDSGANALAVGATVPAGAGSFCGISFTYTMTAGTTSATTFKVRAGGGVAGTTTFNGSGGARFFGGAFVSSISITEILP